MFSPHNKATLQVHTLCCFVLFSHYGHLVEVILLFGKYFTNGLVMRNDQSVICMCVFVFVGACEYDA